MTLFVPWRPAVASALLALLCVVNVSRAQQAEVIPAAFTTFQLNNWTLSPAIHNQTVKGFLAYADPGSIVGSNLSVVWYQREADGSWTTWAWPAYDLTDAVLYVRGTISDNSAFEEDPILSVEAWGTPNGHEPKQVVNG